MRRVYLFDKYTGVHVPNSFNSHLETINMARKSLSVQLAELREYTARLEIELAGYKAMTADHTKRAPRVTSMNELARAYCKAHNVRSCTRQEALNWRHNL